MNSISPLESHVLSRARSHAQELFQADRFAAEPFLVDAIATLRQEGYAAAVIAELEQELAEIQLRIPQG